MSVLQPLIILNGSILNLFDLKFENVSVSSFFFQLLGTVCILDKNGF